MDNFDLILKSLGAQPLDPRLGTMDTGIFKRIDALTENRRLRVMIGSLAFGALTIGITSGLTPADRAVASPTISLSAPSPLAPSQLLVGGPR